ncbi:MAG: lamin tail domain-containing protein [Acidobacteriota bacterium]|nr:lamin tail domain-containing protein [Acidobacteriota bacterium]
MLRTGFLFFFLCSLPLQAQYLRLYYPDIEQGSATLVVAPTGNAMLIDGGSGIKDSDEPIEFFINDLIDAGIVTSLDYIVATHYDEDHIGRLENVYQYVPISPGLITYDRGDVGGTPSTFAFSDYLFQADQYNRTTITPTTTINLGGGVTVRCVVVNGQLPDGSSVDLTGAPQFENAASAAFVVSYGDFQTWIGGDLVGNTDFGHPPVEQAAAPFAGDMDIYTVNHHGSSITSSSQGFLDIIKAEIAINQNSVTNNFGHPTVFVVNRILATADTFSNFPLFLQSNPGKPGDSRSDDSLADGIADPDDVTTIGGEPGTITVLSDGGSYRVYGGDIEPITRLADSGVHTLADFPPAILEISYSPLVPTFSQTTTVEADIRDEDALLSPVITYRVNGVAQTPIAMTQIPATNRYQGVLPARADGEKVVFRVEVTDSAGQTTPSQADGYFSGTTPIATLRDQDAQGILLTRGLSARVQGTITVEPGIFNQSVSQLYVQDASGGLNIFDNEILSDIERGDTVIFTGVVDQFGGVAELVTAGDNGEYGHVRLGPGTAPTPTVVTLSQLDESTEGLLVRINNVTLTGGDTLPESGNATLSITDGVTTRSLRIDGDTDIPGANTPLSSFDIIGIVTQFDTTVPLTFGYQVTPRERADFISDEVNIPAVLISELHTDPDPSEGDANGDGNISSTQDEFVEIVNPGFEPVDISGWTISDAVGTRFTFPADTILPPREAAVVFSGGTPTGDFGNAGANGLVFTAGSLGLNNSGDTVTLADAGGVTVQAVSYGSEGGDNQSLTRDPDWTNTPLVKHTTTTAGLRYSPGTRVDGSPYTLQPGSLLLSEVMYDPNGSDGSKEWIELINVSDTTIDLSDLSIGSGGTDYTSSVIQLSGTVGPGQTFVIGGPDSDGDNANPVFDLVLNFSPDLQNSGTTADGVALFNVRAGQITPATVPIDAVVYGGTNSNNLIDETGSANAPEVGDASGGATIERVDPAGAWQIQGVPTPNESLLLQETGDPSDIILTEVFYDYAGSDNGFEWVEIHNTGDLPVSLAGMSLGSGGNDYTTSTAALGGVIPAGATWVVGGPNSAADNGNPSFDLEINFSPDIQNSGSTADGVALFNVPEGAIGASTVPIDAVIFGGSNANSLIDETGSASPPEVGDAPAGSSIERIDLEGNWQIQAAPDPGNITFSTDPCSGVDIATVISASIPGAEVDIRYGAQNLGDGDSFLGDEGDVVQWRLSVNGFNGPWNSFTVSCDQPDLTVASSDYCDTAIDFPVGGGEIDIRYGPQNLADGDSLFLPQGINFQWRVSLNGFNGPWNTQLSGSSACTVTPTSADYCGLAVDPVLAGAEIDIRYGPQNLTAGNTVNLPTGIDIQWRIAVNGFNGPWKVYAVNDVNCSIAPAEADTCNMLVENDIPGAEVDIRYGPQNLVDGDAVALPAGVNIQWRIAVNGFNGPWNTQSVGSNECVIAPDAADTCTMQVVLDVPGAEVDIRYGPQNLVDGDTVYLPTGIAIQRRTSVNGFNGPWLSQTVGAEGCLIAPEPTETCAVVIETDVPGSEIDIRYGPQNLTEGDTVYLPAGIQIQRRFSVNGFNGPWRVEAVTTGPCDITADNDDYCSVTIAAPAGSQVDLRYGPQNLVNGDTVFLPKQITVQWRLDNGPWQSQTVGSNGCLIDAD